MEQILKILNTLHDDVDFEHEKNLVSDQILDSIDIASLVSELEEEFQIDIGMEYISNEYFESIQTIYNMIQEIIRDS